MGLMGLCKLLAAAPAVMVAMHRGALLAVMGVPGVCMAAVVEVVLLPLRVHLAARAAGVVLALWLLWLGNGVNNDTTASTLFI